MEEFRIKKYDEDIKLLLIHYLCSVVLLVLTIIITSWFIKLLYFAWFITVAVIIGTTAKKFDYYLTQQLIFTELHTKGWVII